MSFDFEVYRDDWSEDDPHANFKAEVAAYSVQDPMPTLENLSSATGVPIPSLIRYILVKYTASGADALLTMPLMVVEQMAQQLAQAEKTGTTEAKIAAYDALRQIVEWLRLGES